MNIHLTPAGHGWLDVQLADSLTAQTFTFLASHTPYDSLYETVVHLIMVIKAVEGRSMARWNAESVAYELWFSTADDWAEVRVTDVSHTGDHHPPTEHFMVRGSRDTIIVAFWRAFRRLESDRSFPSLWQHAFPSTALAQVTTYINRKKLGQ